jgi:signal transduction histidine kinase
MGGRGSDRARALGLFAVLLADGRGRGGAPLTQADDRASIFVLNAVHHRAHDRDAESSDGVGITATRGDARDVEPAAAVADLDREIVALEAARDLDEAEIFIPVFDGIGERLAGGEGDFVNVARPEPAKARVVDDRVPRIAHGSGRPAKPRPIFDHVAMPVPRRAPPQTPLRDRNAKRVTPWDGAVVSSGDRADSVDMPVALRYAPYAGGAFAVLALAILAWGAASPWGGVAFVFAAAGVAGVGALAWFLASDARAQRAAAEARIGALEVRDRDLQAWVARLERTKQESEAILGAVRSHLMVIDPSFLITARYATGLDDVLRGSDRGSENFLNVLQRLLSERMFKTARDYLALLFDPAKKERMVRRVNPLDEVEVNVTEADGTLAVRYLSFDFRRLTEGDAIANVIVIVEDRTEAVLRERQLRESEQQKVRQFELLVSILHVPPAALDEFVQTANAELAFVDDALKATDFMSATVGQTALLRQRLDVVLQRVHNVKGNASLLQLDPFEKRLQEFEQKVIDLKYRSALGGDDFLTVVIALAEFRTDLDDLQALRVKLAGIRRNVEAAASPIADDDLVANVGELAASLAQKLEKSVKVDADGFDTRPLPAPLRLAIKDVLVQLTRNSIVHGIESPAEREAAGKPRAATIAIHRLADAPAGTFSFTFRDDGRGLDPRKIRARAIAQGLLPAERSDAVADSDVAGFIFAPGFSTAETATVDAGRGVGMNVVKQRIVDDCAGEIGLNSEPGEFTEFTFVLPLQVPAIAGCR